MIDPNVLRTQLDWVAENLKKRGFHLDTEKFLALEWERKALQVKTQSLQNHRKVLSKSIGQAKSMGEDTTFLMQEVEKIVVDLGHTETHLTQVVDQLNDYLAGVPNLLHESVPLGKDETENVEIKKWGNISDVAFTPKDHVDLSSASQSIDFQTAAKLSGSRFVVLRNQAARLHRALAQFMLDMHINEHGYEEIYVPYLVEHHALFGTGQLPKLEQDLFHIKGEKALSLIPTAEVPLTNLVRESILPFDSLPLKFVSHTPCFRSEAGSYGKDTRGMFRQHQFDKVELVQIVAPEASAAAHEELTYHAERILQALELPYRVVMLCSGDMGFAAAKTYDLEVWLPSQKRYREISSCSNMEAFQARRMHARLRRTNSKPELVHTLNGSGLAVGRTLIAVLENYQDEHGDVAIPRVLQPYLHGVKKLLFSVK